MCLHFLKGPYNLLQLYEDMDMAGVARTFTRFHQDMVMVNKCMLQGVYFLSQPPDNSETGYYMMSE